MVLPSIFSELQNKVDHIVKKGTNEWSSSCPECGGRDRFVYLTNATGFHKEFAFCRQCDYKYYPDAPESPAYREDVAIRREAQKMVAEFKVSKFQEKENWMKYHENLPDQIRKMWNYRGLDDDAIDYYKLGYKSDYVTADNESTDALTIPIFDFTGKCVQIYYRLLKNVKNGKYRQTNGLPPALLFTDYDYPEYQNVFLIEGQIKAMVVYEMILKEQDGKPYASYYKDMQVVGMPSCNPGEDLILQLKQAKKVWINLDPDTYIPQKNKVIAHDSFVGRAKQLLPETEFYDVRLFGKLDDMILEGKMNIHNFTRILKYANRL